MKSEMRITTERDVPLRVVRRIEDAGTDPWVEFYDLRRGAPDEGWLIASYYESDVLDSASLMGLCLHIGASEYNVDRASMVKIQSWIWGLDS